MQYITMFGTLMKIDEDFDIDVRPTLPCPILLRIPLIAGPSIFDYVANVRFLSGPGKRMPQDRTVAEVVGDWTVYAEMGFVASGFDVCFLILDGVVYE